MLAAVIDGYQKPVEVKKLPIPQIGPEEVLVKVMAASINPVDLKTAAGKVKMLLHYRFPLQLGSDFAGVIIAVGGKVNDFQVGDQVYGRVQKNRIGTWAEYLAVATTDIALKPANLTFAEAAALPLVGLTSYQALYEIMQLKPKEKVLIQAGSGGIGTVAIQLAKAAGAYVATTTSEKNRPLVKALGADQVIDYHRTDFTKVLQDFDAVFDTLGGEQLEKAFQIIKPKGQIVSISGLPNKRFGVAYGAPWWKQLAFSIATRKLSRLEKDTDATYTFLFMKPSGAQLAELSELVATGKLVPVIDTVYPFAELKQAISHSSSGRARGKIVLAMGEK